MADCKSFLGLHVWRKSSELYLMVYRATANFLKEKMYGLASQMCSAAVPISSNIAQGYGRQPSKENIPFQYTAKGSVNELEAHLYSALRLNFVGENSFNKLNDAIADSRKLLIGFVSYSENRNSK